ncbi:MAG TPA: DNA-binding protein WhiA [Candidatus Copromorpha excrementigallinarum]|uniref:Probable cell division protein WhiA n=1 Tax=Candidatus Allocopromorpha excrementigallinarum TaxID=2840742 RepID=A0A9D1I0T9_9FIRM|nr:DNA-binding protein WhiA [Candidatus Copromorpha excrementigallinarum]
MSFASETKNELARTVPEKKCCMLAEIAGFMRLSGSIKLVGGGRFQIIMTTANPAVARHYKTLIKNYFSVDTDLEVEEGSSLGRRREVLLSIGPENLSEQILRETGILMVREGMNCISDGIYDGLIRTKCCRKAYLRGAFLAAGTVSNPEKSYHFEIFAATEILAKELKRLMNSFVDITAKVVSRKNGFGVYVKAGEQIKDILAIMGATNQFFRFDSVMMMKELKSQTYRINNLDNANIDKSLDAAERQMESILKIKRKRGLEFLSAKLRETAEARLNNPEVGIEELGRMMSPPLSKSGINNRLRRIEEIAKTL